jgi:hypothetical protein
MYFIPTSFVQNEKKRVIHTCLKKSMMAPLGEGAVGLEGAADLVGEVGDMLLPVLLP